MPEKACTNCGTPTPQGPRCPDCRTNRGNYHQRKKIRNAIIRRDGLICRICHLPVDPSELHIDHIQPLADGGSNAISNQRVTHAACNLQRGRGANESRGAQK